MWDSNQAAFDGILGAEFGISIFDFNFDANYYTELCAFMGIDIDQLDTKRFAEDHCNLFYGYLQFRALEGRAAKVGKGNEALENVAKQIVQLEDALKSLSNFGDSRQRLIDQVIANQPSQFQINGVGLSDFFAGPPHDKIGAFSATLYDLRLCLERAQIKKRKPVKPLGDLAYDRKYKRTLSSVMFDHHVMRGLDRDQEKEYQRRYKESRYPTNSAIYHFIEIFEEFWHEYSDLRFTEGRYERDARQTISATVDAAAHCLDRYGAQCPRSLIVSKVKRIRQERYK